ncbi:peptidoglycan-binding protein [Streptomyces sp. NPDC001797]|uniref:peptidoglycan-binding protein n=1 Tax=Streptomyces sp. NPDC001797 TaxID=3364610 RepID=UPI0036B9A2BC
MPDLWLPGAEHLDIGDHAPCDGGPAKALVHITWDKNATKAKPQDLVPFADLRSYFSGSGSGMAPHILWSPFTGQFTQFVPANSRSKSVVDQPGGTRTNRAGQVVIQVEALFFPWCRYDGKVYESLSDTPGKGWDELHAWVKSWGVPDVWPMGKPNGFVGHRDEHTWETKAGWYAHAQVPENDHTDPGTWFDFPAAPQTPDPREDVRALPWGRLVLHGPEVPDRGPHA